MNFDEFKQNSANYNLIIDSWFTKNIISTQLMAFDGFVFGMQAEELANRINIVIDHYLQPNWPHAN